ncbi:MAG: DNA-binding response regulator, partial [Chloroflexi bacterium]
MSNAAQIIVLEGPLSQGVTEILTQAGWIVTRAADTSELLSRAGEAALVVVDGLAPGMDLEARRQLAQRMEAPLLVIVPALETDHEVVTLRAPFEPEMLIQQARKLLAETRTEVVQVGELASDLTTARVILAGKLVDLSSMELRMLIYLARNVGQVVAYDALLTEVWGYAPGTGDRKVVTNCVRRLRKKLGESAAHPEYIVTARGVGYRLC